MRDALHAVLAAGVPGLELNGHPEHRLPNTLNVSFPRASSPALLRTAGAVRLSVGMPTTEDEARHAGCTLVEAWWAVQRS